MLMKTLIGPSKYVQGPGAVAEVGKYAAAMGDRALIVGGKTALQAGEDADDDVDDGWCDRLGPKEQLVHGDLDLAVAGLDACREQQVLALREQA